MRPYTEMVYTVNGMNPAYNIPENSGLSGPAAGEYVVAMEKQLCSCGGEAEIVHWTSEFCCVYCSRCGAKTAWVEYETDAINAWNEKKGISNCFERMKI